MKVVIVFMVLVVATVAVLKHLQHEERKEALQSGVSVQVEVIDRGASTKSRAGKSVTRRSKKLYVVVFHKETNTEEKIYLIREYYHKIKVGDVLSASLHEGDIYLRDYPRK